MAKTSPIWLVESKEFRSIISRCRTKSEVLSHFGLSRHGNNYSTLNRRIEEEGIDTSHFNEYRTKVAIGANTIPLKDILVENSTYTNTSNLKRRLIKSGLIVEVCDECGIGNEWRNAFLSLQLDHINGIRDDNRIENLRLLCPNCHSQTSTFAGKKPKVRQYNCNECGESIVTNSKFCRSCSMKNNRKVDRPSLDQLKKDVKELGYSGTGRKYGVSDNAIRKWFKYYSGLG